MEYGGNFLSQSDVGRIDEFEHFHGKGWILGDNFRDVLNVRLFPLNGVKNRNGDTGKRGQFFPFGHQFVRKNRNCQCSSYAVGGAAQSACRPADNRLSKLSFGTGLPPVMPKAPYGSRASFASAVNPASHPPPLALSPLIRLTSLSP
jgi:hypothetical protein